jgi:hypothetical protein
MRICGWLSDSTLKASRSIRVVPPALARCPGITATSAAASETHCAMRDLDPARLDLAALAKGHQGHLQGGW